MTSSAIQDRYPDAVSYCYGCGRLNPDGLHIRSFRDGDEAVCHFQPRPYHIAIPGFVYGGLIASLVDCHAMGTAAAAALADQPPGAEAPRFVTASLKVDYLRPTPLGPLLELRGRVVDLTGRKAVVAVTVTVDGVITARGEVVAVRMPDDWQPAA
ncbi:MAG: PaaI family thioesterase [Caldilineae bacterium]|nr:PaaI family thioesterase [Anaerolineae bacterium]MCB9152626.1 PaaI family thioesterase [Caldilineae bacterium]